MFMHRCAACNLQFWNFATILHWEDARSDFARTFQKKKCSKLYSYRKSLIYMHHHRQPHSLCCLTSTQTWSYYLILLSRYQLKIKHCFNQLFFQTYYFISIIHIIGFWYLESIQIWINNYTFEINKKKCLLPWIAHSHLHPNGWRKRSRPE